MNIIEIFGHLGADAETRFTPSGQKVTTLRVACNTKRGGKEETLWWQVTLWGDSYDKILPYLKKGSAIIVVGEMSKPEIYTDKEGRTQVSLRMTAEFLRFSPFGRPDRPAGETQQSGYAGQTAGNLQMNSGGFSDGGFSAGSAGYAGAAVQQETEEDSMPF
jgi:single-strand DNA-binding protein